MRGGARVGGPGEHAHTRARPPSACAAVLEGIVQSLQEELGEKKKLIKQLMGGGAGVEVKSDVSKTVAAAGNDVALLRSLLESSLAEGARIKHDMRVVGDELSEAQEKLGRAAAERGALLARVSEAEAAAAAARREAAEAAAERQRGYGDGYDGGQEDGRGSGLAYGDERGSCDSPALVRGTGTPGAAGGRPGSEAEAEGPPPPPPPPTGVDDDDRGGLSNPFLV